MSISQDANYKVIYLAIENTLLSKQPIPLRRAFLTYVVIYFLVKGSKIISIQ